MPRWLFLNAETPEASFQPGPSLDQEWACVSFAGMRPCLCPYSQHEHCPGLFRLHCCQCWLSAQLGRMARGWVGARSGLVAVLQIGRLACPSGWSRAPCSRSVPTGRVEEPLHLMAPLLHSVLGRDKTRTMAFAKLQLFPGFALAEAEDGVEWSGVDLSTSSS